MRKAILVIGTALALTALVFAGGNYGANCSPQNCPGPCEQCCCPGNPGCCR